MVFIFIIISIVTNREEKEEETAEEDSISGSHKSPGSKTNRSDSLSFGQRRGGPGGPGPGGGPGGGPNATANHRHSRNNSQSSSLLNNRLSLAEAAGPDALPPRHARNGSSGGGTHPPSSPSGTLKRGTLSRQQSQRGDNLPLQVRVKTF